MAPAVQQDTKGSSRSGAIPAAILGALGDKNDLGMHGGLIDDGGMALVRAGNVNGSRKPMDTGLHVTGMALGTGLLIMDSII